MQQPNVGDQRISVKIIGTNGQISLGKEFAGRQVLVEEREPGVWLVRAAIVIPENEMWLHGSKASSEIEQALKWAQSHSARESDPVAVVKRLEGVKRQRSKHGQTRSK